MNGKILPFIQSFTFYSKNEGTISRVELGLTEAAAQ